MEARPLGPPIPEGFERVARGREAHPGSTWERKATLEGLKDPQPSHPAGVRIPSRRAFPRVRASHDPGLSAPIPPGCLHAGGVGAGRASWDKPIAQATRTSPPRSMRGRYQMRLGKPETREWTFSALPRLAAGEAFQRHARAHGTAALRIGVSFWPLGCGKRNGITPTRSIAPSATGRTGPLRVPRAHPPPIARPPVGVRPTIGSTAGKRGSRWTRARRV